EQPACRPVRRLGSAGGSAGSTMRVTASGLDHAVSSTSALIVEEPTLRCAVSRRASMVEDPIGRISLEGRTPVSVLRMRPWLDRYPKRKDAGVLLEGFSTGFWIPFVRSDSPSLADNLRSVVGKESILEDKLRKEVCLGRMAGPFDSPPFPNLRVSPLGLVPKKEPGSFRLIHHLSYPSGGSVNDDIDKEESHVRYASFDRALELVREAGKGALLAKSDIESAFRLFPVHPDCFHLLGCRFQGSFFFDMCLPMGCAISCSYFEMFASFLEWVVARVAGIESLTHYLDDFLFVGPRESDDCDKGKDPRSELQQTP
ncbi:Hypothetical predicted protein, partial [Pelobates cultripes]